MIIIVIIIAIMIMMIEIILIIAVVIINSPFQQGDFSTGSTAGIYQDILNKSDADEINTDKELPEDVMTIKTYIFRLFYYLKLCILSR